VDRCLHLVNVLESNRRCINLSPFGEPQLGRRGLYRSAGGAVATPDDERALLWVLNQSDGRSSLLDIADRSGLTYAVVARAAERLERAGLLATSLSATPPQRLPSVRPRQGDRRDGDRADRGRTRGRAG
jgi:aminopeptidase-like protein